MPTLTTSLIGDCDDPAFEQQLVDFHSIDATTFVNLVVNFFTCFPFPLPQVVSKPAMMALLLGQSCKTDAVCLDGDQLVMNNMDILCKIAPPADICYSISLFRGIMTRFTTMTEFHFYKGFDPVASYYTIIFQVWDGVNNVSLYNGDASSQYP